MRPLSLLLALFLLWSSAGCARFDTYYGKFGSTTLSFELPKDWQETGRNQWSKGGKQLTLGEVRIAEADEASLEERAKQFQSHHSTLQLDKFQPLELGDQAAYFVEYTWGLPNRRKQAGYVYWSGGDKDVVLHYINGNYDSSVLEHAVETLSFDAERPATSQTKTKTRTKTPKWMYHLGFLLLFCGFPGAVGGALSYSSPRGNEEEYLRAVSQGTRLPGFLGTLVGCSAMGIYAFSEIGARFQSNGNLLAGIVLVFMLGAAILAVLAVSFVSGRAAGAGARRGARQSRIGAALGGGLGAILGAIILPLILSYM